MTVTPVRQPFTMSFAEWQKHHYELLLLFELLKVPPIKKKKSGTDVSPSFFAKLAIHSVFSLDLQK